MKDGNWYAVITADVLYDNSINARQKLLIAVISNLSNTKGYCFASNAHLAELMNVSVSTIQRDISTLEGKYIGRVVNLKENGEVDYRALTPINNSTPIAPVLPPHSTSDTTPHSTSDTYNNIYNNNKSNTNDFTQQVEQLYSLYPTKCELRNRSTGKSAKDKQTLQKRIQEFGFDYVKNSISYYLDDAKKSESFLKNFSTLLNNLPEPPQEYTAEKKEVKVNKTWMDNSGNNCANYIDDDGNIYSMREVELDFSTRKFYLKNLSK